MFLSADLPTFPLPQQKEETELQETVFLDIFAFKQRTAESWQEMYGLIFVSQSWAQDRKFWAQTRDKTANYKLLSLEILSCANKSAQSRDKLLLSA